MRPPVRAATPVATSQSGKISPPCAMPSGLRLPGTSWTSTTLVLPPTSVTTMLWELKPRTHYNETGRDRPAAASSAYSTVPYWGYASVQFAVSDVIPATTRTQVSSKQFFPSRTCADHIAAPERAVEQHPRRLIGDRALDRPAQCRAPYTGSCIRRRERIERRIRHAQPTPARSMRRLTVPRSRCSDPAGVLGARKLVKRR